MKFTELKAVYNKKGEFMKYYIKKNGHKLTLDELTYNTFTRGLNYTILDETIIVD